MNKLCFVLETLRRHDRGLCGASDQTLYHWDTNQKLPEEEMCIHMFELKVAKESRRKPGQGSTQGTCKDSDTAIRLLVVLRTHRGQKKV